jgi:hypothetical protein
MIHYRRRRRVGLAFSIPSAKDYDHWARLQFESLSGPDSVLSKCLQVWVLRSSTCNRIG